jgi:hypothetical protein
MSLQELFLAAQRMELQLSCRIPLSNSFVSGVKWQILREIFIYQSIHFWGPFSVMTPWSLVAWARYSEDGDIYSSDSLVITRHGVITRRTTMWILRDVKSVSDVKLSLGRLRTSLSFEMRRSGGNYCLLLQDSIHYLVSITRLASLVYSCCSYLEHNASVKRVVSLQYLNLRHSVSLLGRVISPSQSRYLTEIQNKHRYSCLEWDSNRWSQRSSERRQFMPQTARTL